MAQLNGEEIRRALEDAGCDEEYIQRFLLAWEQGTLKECLCLLSCCRCKLLECVHTAQQRLDCLDHLRYELQKQVKD